MPDAPGRSSRVVGLGGLLVLLGGVTLALRVAPYQIDDANIFFRYAANIAGGHGPTFNVGLPPVEGFSSPLWTVVLALAARFLGVGQLPHAATALGLATYAVCVVLLLRLARARGACDSYLGALACLLPAALWGLSPGATYYAVTGMDAPLFVMAVVAFHGAASGTLDLRLGLIAAALGTWVRPEGGWMLVAGLCQLVAQRELVARGRRFGIPLIAAAVCGGVLLVAIRWRIFHDVLPNTFYAKRPSSDLGLRYFIDALKTPWSALIAAAGLVGAIAGDRAHRGFFAAGLAWLAAAVLEGGDWMPAFRLLQPALALFALAAGGVGSLLARRPIAARIVLALFVVVIPVEVEAAIERGDTALRSFREQRLGALAMATWFRSSGASSIALIDIGELGFACPNATVFDLAGLTDSRIAHSGGRHLHKEIDPGYVIDELKPDVILLRVRRIPGRGPDGALAPRPEDSMSQVEGDLLYDSRLLKSYRPLFVQAPPVIHDPLYARLVLVRREVRLAPGAMPPSDVVSLSTAEEP